MKCPHCGTAFHNNWYEEPIMRHGRQLETWQVRNAVCPECTGHIIEFGRRHLVTNMLVWQMAHPNGASRGPVAPSVPSSIAEDYIEACNVLPISAKASAALSRRCLQNILRANGYKAKDLAKEIDSFLGETDPSKSAPSSLKDVVDGIRNFGNFSAHPINDLTSLQIIAVEPEEAEWCLEILEEMFQHFYERPAQAAARKAALNAKLASAGKPPAK